MTDADQSPIELAFPGGVSADAPCLDGHFPGNPIVPGAMLLGHAAAGLRARGWEVASVVRMKFLRPLPPASPFGISVDIGETASTIRWQADDEVIAQARVTLRASSG
ncbi:hypothetical protein KHP62_03640 [Rhodobacteraceae bacterium NNCM2]|nr:hypothetical protein [Coraliihabitans acroporae]